MLSNVFFNTEKITIANQYYTLICTMRTNRRDFLKTLGGIAAFTIVPRHVLGNGFIAPSDQLTKGIIGTGGMGRGHVNYAGTRLVPLSFLLSI